MYIFCTLPCHGVIQGGWKWTVSRWRLSDQLMLHARKCYIVHAWVLHVHLHTCVYFVSSTYIYLLCSVKRDASVQCACILYNHACMHFTKCFGCAVWYLDAQSILSMWSSSDVLLQLWCEVGGVCNSAQQKCCCMSMFVHSRSLSFRCVNVSVLF